MRQLKDIYNMMKKITAGALRRKEMFFLPLRPSG
jgi:hypothetical protein